MKDASPNTIYLKDYAQPSYWIDEVALTFELGETRTRVVSVLSLRRNDATSVDQTLVLTGEALKLGQLKLNGQLLDEAGYEVSESELTIHSVPEKFSLEVETFIKPQENTSLEGLYKSSGNFCTQCEAEGFRKITYYLDRPDVMAIFSTTIIADKKKYPVLLSNGNPSDSGEYEDGRHWAQWHDPYKKPCYLFALVAGDLSFIEDRFTTMHGREILLRIYVQHHNINQCDHAMRSLIKAMRWDEEVYAREYDLDVYNIVAVDDFNMGAMENKGLNVFNSKYVLARQETATDNDFINIESVIAHEYFHNWSGNRVTCRDWFQLTLKEGLTVFRDQQFTADMNASTPKRIDDVNVLRTSQFAEDGGPMAHPIQPDAYLEINNFYTVTVYNKGAEVIRMIHTLLGAASFRKGMDLYFERHDGQAVTTEEFVKAMEDANNADLKLFRRWYKQAGTPVVTLNEKYDASQQQYTLEFEQKTQATPGQEIKQPFHIPIVLGLLDERGNDMEVSVAGVADKTCSHVLNLTKAKQEFVFSGVKHKPVLSAFRGFSAPVKFEFQRSDKELAFGMAHDSNEFNRWDAGQQLATRMILDMIEVSKNNRPLEMPDHYVEATRQILREPSMDKALAARALTLPSHAFIAEAMDCIDVDAIHQSREFIRYQLAQDLHAEWLQVYTQNQSEQFDLSPESMGQRALKNTAMGYLMVLDNASSDAQVLEQFNSATNMTDQLAAFRALVHHDATSANDVVEGFYQQWHKDPLVMDKWFTIQATAPLASTLDRVKSLFEHVDFELKNPNRVRSLLGAYCAANPVCFHDKTGSGYQLLGHYIERLDHINPQIAARLTIPMTRWKRYDDQRQRLMRVELERLSSLPSLSRDVYEVVVKSLK